MGWSHSYGADVKNIQPPLTIWGGKTTWQYTCFCIRGILKLSTTHPNYRSGGWGKLYHILGNISSTPESTTCLWRSTLQQIKAADYMCISLVAMVVLLVPVSAGWTLLGSVSHI